MAQEAQYTEDNIRSLEWDEHIRLRPGMYIGKLGDGKSPDDGIYILLKEVIDNCIDEFVMGAGKTIEITIKDKTVKVRDYGRGIPLGKVVDVVSKMNTGGKYDSRAFKKSVGLNGVGTKAVNALSSFFEVQSSRDNQVKTAQFSFGNLFHEFNFLFHKFYPFLGMLCNHTSCLTSKDHARMIKSLFNFSICKAYQNSPTSYIFLFSSNPH